MDPYRVIRYRKGNITRSINTKCFSLFNDTHFIEEQILYYD